MPSRIPTERQVLRCIYDTYEPKFPVEGAQAGTVFVQIDMEAIARQLGCDKHVLFGYLYYHLDYKYRYPSGEKSHVHLFAPSAGELKNAINLPYLAAILAGQDQEHSKFVWSLGVSLIALALSVGAIVAQLVSAK
jgi:hypothetical protein